MTRFCSSGLYNVAHEATRGSMDTHFPRLGQMIIDYDAPIKKMTEEFIPLSKVESVEYLLCYGWMKVGSW